MTGLRGLRLRGDELEVVLLPEMGGRVHRIRAFGEDLLRTPGDPAVHVADPFMWGAYVMAPWCNRARPGPMELAGRRVDLAPNFPDGTAIHGLISSAPWARSGDGELAIRHDGGRGWPWTFEVRQTARVDGAALDLEYRLANLDAGAPMPAGVGLHPWFRRPIEVRLPAERVYASNSESPVTPMPVDGEHDLRTLAPPTDGLDATWTGLTQQRVELAWPGSGIRGLLEVETDAGAACVAVATPPDMDAIAVEPQTHGPDPLRRIAAEEPDAPVLLPPGASMRLTVRLSFERGAGRP
jgi:aldose 1-epimerase